LLFLVLALLRGFIYAAVIPPWQSPDEHGHFEYAWLISEYGPFVGPESISPEFQQRVLESMAQFDYWRLVHQPTPETLPSSLTDPSDPLLKLSRPQVGDERPLYYLIAGGLLQLVDTSDMVTGMYIGRITSVILFAAAVGVATVASQSLFPQSRFMRIVPPAFLLFLPMLGQMSAAVSSDAMGVLASTLFFASLIPVFRDGMTWRRGGAAIAALVLALLSKKPAVFLAPTALFALPLYGWTRGLKLSRRTKGSLTIATALPIVSIVILALVPGEDAVEWIAWTGSCGATRSEEEAFEGEAALWIGPCPDETVSQTLPLDTTEQIIGTQITLNGWGRSVSGPSTSRVSIYDSEGQSQTEFTAGEEWQPFVLTHTVASQAKWLAVRFAWEGPGDALMFDKLSLTADQGDNLLANASAEQEESLLLDVVGNLIHQVGGPRRLVERVLRPQSWSLEAWQEYARSALFCFHSFWGLFGSQAVPLPRPWYWATEIVCALALVDNVAFIASRPRREWQVGYLFVLIGGASILALQTLLPMVVNRGTYWLPQGRYLFPGVFAIAVLITWGFDRLLPLRWERWTTLTSVGLLVGFDWACLGFLILPYFHAPG
jgi:hypothetical protein